MKKRKLLYLFPVAALLLSGCSKEDLMFWKKKAEEEQQQSQEGGEQGGQQGGEQQGGEQGGQQGGGEQGGGGEQQQNPIDFVGLALNDSTVTYDGQPHSLTVSGDLPEGATVSYGEAGNTFTAVGDHEVTATVSAEGYNTLTLTGTLHIVSAEFAGLSFEGATVTYDGQPHSLTVAGELPAGATVDYGTEGNTFTNAGTYEITATVHCEGYVDATFTATLTINKANFEGIVFEDAQVAYDGQPHTLAPQVPAAYEGAVVTYDEAGNEFTGSGLHVINATVALANYNDWTGSAKLIIGAGPAASAKLEVIDFEGLSDNDLADEFDLKFYNNGWVTPQSFKVGIEKNQVFGTGTNTMKMTMTHQGAAFKATKDLGNAKTYNKYKGFAIDTMMDSRAEGGTMKLAVQFWFKDLPLPDEYAGYRNTYATYTLANNAPSIWTHWEIPFDDSSLKIADNPTIPGLNVTLTQYLLAAGYTVEEFSAYIDQVAIIITPNYKDGKNCYAYVDNLELTTGTEKVVEKHLVGGRYGADANGTYLDMNLSADLTSAEFFINGVSNATLTAEKAGTKVTFKDSAYAGAGLTVVADITDTGTLAISSITGQAAAEYAMLNGLEFAKLAKLNYDLQNEPAQNHDLVDANWKQEKYQEGWQNISGQMRVRFSGENVFCNMSTGYYMDYRYTYTNPVELGLANKFSVDVANDYSGCADIKVKVRLIEANGTEHFVAGDANNYQVVPANTAKWSHIEVNLDTAINVKAVMFTIKSTRNSNDFFYFDNLKCEYHVDYPAPAFVPTGDLLGGARIKCLTQAGSDTGYVTELNVGGGGNGNFAGEGVYLRVKNNTGVDTPITMKFNSTNTAIFGPKTGVNHTYYDVDGNEVAGIAARTWGHYLMLPANFDGFIYLNYETQMEHIEGATTFDPAHMWRVYIEYSGYYDNYADFEIGDIFTDSQRVLDGSSLDSENFAATWINQTGAVQEVTQLEGGVVPPQVQYANINYDLQDKTGQVGNPLNDSQWTVKHYGNNGWVDDTNKMNVRNSGDNVFCNMAVGYSMDYVFTFTPTSGAGVANHFSVDLANDFSGAQEIKVKVKLILEDNSEVFIVGDGSNYVSIPANTPKWHNVELTFAEANVKAVKFIVKSAMNGSAYLYFDNLIINYVAPVSNAVYTVENFDWWTNDGAHIYAWAFGEGVEGHWYEGVVDGANMNFTIPANCTKASFVRVSGEIADLSTWDANTFDGMQKWNRSAEINLSGSTSVITVDLSGAWFD